MTQSRVKNSAKNTFFAALNMLVQILLKFAVRIVFVRFLSVEYLGLNTLFPTFCRFCRWRSWV